MDIDDVFWEVSLNQYKHSAQYNGNTDQLYNNDQLAFVKSRYNNNDSDNITDDNEYRYDEDYYKLYELLHLENNMNIAGIEQDYHSRSCDTSNEEWLEVDVWEDLEGGVFRSVSTEVWEAAVLLSAHLIAHRDIWLPSAVHGIDHNASNIVELGCGCGLVGLVATKILHQHLALQRKQQLRVDRNHRCHASVTFTDVDVVALKLLDTNLQEQLALATSPLIYPTNRTTNHTTFNESDEVCKGQLSIIIQRLDWFDYAPPSRSQETEAYQLRRVSASVILGSALVYSPQHCVLADVLRHFIVDNDCEKAILLQIIDRPGFDLFLNRLKVLGLNYSVNEIANDVADICSNIRASSCSLQYDDTMQIADERSGGRGEKAGGGRGEKAGGGRGEKAGGKGEDKVLVQKRTLSFPLRSSSMVGCEGVVTQCAGSSASLLIKTPLAAFRIITVTK